MSNHQQIGMVVAGHGSQHKEAVLEFQKMMASIEEIQKGIVVYGFLEFASPGIADAIDHAIDAGAKTVVVLPAMLTAAHHVQKDIPNIIQNAQQKHPLIPIHYGRHLDLHPKVITLSKNRIDQSCPKDHKNTLLMVVGRGSSNPASNEDVIHLTDLLKQSFGFGEARYCYTSVAHPLFKDALSQTEQLPYRSLLIFPYLLFSGVLVHKIEECTRQFQKDHPDYFVKIADSLGPDPLVRDALIDRFNEAIQKIKMGE